MSAVDEMAFVARFLDGSPHLPRRGDAYILVRLIEPPEAAQAVTVYLRDGTALVVSGRDLLQLAPAEGA